MLVLGAEDVGKVMLAGPFDAFLCDTSCLSAALASTHRIMLCPHRIEHLRDLKAFFGTTFKIRPVVRDSPSGEEASGEDAAMNSIRVGAAPGSQEFVLSCVGTGFTNTARRAG